MKFAFIIMNNFNSKEDRAYIHGGAAQIIGVKDIEDAIAEQESCKQTESAVLSFVEHLEPKEQRGLLTQPIIRSL